MGNSNDFLRCVSEGMAAIILCSESRACCRESVELLYRQCTEFPNSSENIEVPEDIRDVKDANGAVVPFVVQVPEEHLTVLEHRYMSNFDQLPGQLAFVRLPSCKDAAT